MNRIPLLLALWFGLWTTIGYSIDQSLETPVVYTVTGIVFALVSIFSWPFIFPERLQDWMER